MNVNRKLVLGSSLLIFAVAAFVVAVNAQRPHSQRKRNPDKIIATKTIQGKFMGFESGDYLHAVIETIDGKKDSFLIRPPGMEYFLVLYKDLPLEATYQIADAYVPEVGGGQRIEQLIAAKAGAVTYASWWKSTKRKFTMEQLEKKYGGLIDKATIQPR
jgi:hypothetical protein